jgi:hypothetical protein
LRLERFALVRQPKGLGFGKIKVLKKSLGSRLLPLSPMMGICIYLLMA